MPKSEPPALMSLRFISYSSFAFDTCWQGYTSCNIKQYVNKHAALHMIADECVPEHVRSMCTVLLFYVCACVEYSQSHIHVG